MSSPSHTRRPRESYPHANDPSRRQYQTPPGYPQGHVYGYQTYDQTPRDHYQQETGPFFMPDFFLAPDAGLGPSVPMTSQYGEQNVDYTYTPIPAGPMPPNYVEWPGPQASISPFSNTHVFPVSSPTFPPAGPHVGRPPSQPLHSPLPFQETGNVQSMIPFQPVHGQHGHGHRSQTPRPMPIIMFNNDDAPRQSAKDSWKNITTTAKCAGPGGMFIPQRIYRPPTDSDRARYVSQVTLDEPIVFMSTSPEEHGIHLVDALHCRTRRLLGRDETVFDGRGPSVSIRVEWPCYGSWSRQIPTRDFRTPPGPITREKLAKNIAKQIERFIKEKQDCPPEEETNPVWRVGPEGIKFEDLTLVSLHHVSQGSWQPQLRLRRPLM